MSTCRNDDVEEEGEGVLRRPDGGLAVLHVGRDVGVERREQPRRGRSSRPPLEETVDEAFGQI